MKEEGLEYDALKQGSFHTMFLFFLLSQNALLFCCNRYNIAQLQGQL